MQRTTKAMAMMRRTLPLTCLLLAVGLLPKPALAGGQLTLPNLTGFPDDLPPGPIAGSVAVPQVAAQWDTRCLPLDYTLNTEALPNAEPPLDVATTRQALNRALAAWTDIPTSFIEMGLGGELQRPRLGPFDYTVFDFINELNFLSGTEAFYVAISPNTSLFADTVLNAGDDLDGDGDSDVFDPAVTGRQTCGDVDGDGDFEFPAGFYAAGTMLDNDVSFNNSVVWTTGPPDAIFGNFDLEAVAVHELGHSHGLSHSAINQFSATDGTSATMLPSIFSNDAVGQEALRSPSSDDVAWSSFVYPEGSASHGIAALQAGDVAFDHVYGVIRGEVRQGELGLPLAGGSVYAVDEDSGEIVASHYTGEVQGLFIPDTGFFGYLPEFADFHLISGSYTLPVPAGDYHLAVEPLDGFPVSANSVSTPASVGLSLGLLSFNEGYFLKKPHGHGHQHRGGGGGLDKLKLRQVKVRAGRDVWEVDHTTAVEVNVEPFDSLGFGGFFDFDTVAFGSAQPGWLYAVEFPAEEILEALDAGLSPRSAAFRTYLVENSVPFVVASASLVTGIIDGGGGALLDLDDPLVEVDEDPSQQGDDIFIGQDNDFSQLLFDKPAHLARDLRRAIDRDGVEHFFLVLELPEAFGGLQGLPYFIGADTGPELGLLGRSYVSLDGGASFFRFDPFNFMFRLTFG